MSTDNNHRRRQRNWDDVLPQQAFATENDKIHRPIEFVQGFTFSQEYVEYLYEHFEKKNCTEPVQQVCSTESSSVYYMCSGCLTQVKFKSADKMTCPTCQRSVFIKMKKQQ